MVELRQESKKKSENSATVKMSQIYLNIPYK